MAAIVYPPTLPGPSAFPFVRRDPRATPPQEGLTQHRQRSRELIVDAKGVRWRYTPAEMEVWRAWWKDTLLDGQLWFAMTLPGPGGWLPRVARYVSSSKRDHLAAGNYEVSADLEINYSRVPPQEPVPLPHICWATDPEAVGAGFPSATLCFRTPIEAITADIESIGGASNGYFVLGCYVAEDGTNYCITKQVFPAGFEQITHNLMIPRTEV